MKKLLITLQLIFMAKLSMAQELTISKQRVRLMPDNSPSTAAFMKIKNNTNKDIKITKATSDFSKKTEIHNHIMENGMMKMREVPFLLIPANQEIELKPGGLHIMLIGFKKKLSNTKEVTLKLLFNKKSLKVSVPIKKIEHHHHH